MSDRRRHIVDLYSRHPISARHILAKLRAARGDLRKVRPEELWPHDQDHYGGLAANEAIARAAGIGAGTRVVDFCAGLGGPARYFAHACGALVTGIELNPDRAAGAIQLTRLVGLADRVRILQGDVGAVPLDDGSADAVISQEAFLHVADKGGALAEAGRLLVPGGRLCFTDWIVHAGLPPDQADLLWRGLGAQRLQSIAGYRRLIEAAGFAVVSVDDLTAAWAPILAERRAMYAELRAEAAAAAMPAGDEDFYRAYVLLVDGVRAGRLGGARFTARR
jgi:SAM-dependent methyltransferase